MFYIIQYIEWILQLIEFIVNLIVVIFYLMIYKIRYVGMSLFYMIDYIFDLFKKLLIIVLFMCERWFRNLLKRVLFFTHDLLYKLVIL